MYLTYGKIMVWKIYSDHFVAVSGIGVYNMEKECFFLFCLDFVSKWAAKNLSAIYIDDHIYDFLMLVW